MSDTVNHPKHYNSHPSGVEAITVCRHMSFNVGNVIKYLWRADHKHSTPTEDLKKAEFYLKDEIARLQKAAEELEILQEQREIVPIDPDIVDAWQDWTYLSPTLQTFVIEMQRQMNIDLDKQVPLEMDYKKICLQLREMVKRLELLSEPPISSDAVLLAESAKTSVLCLSLLMIRLEEQIHG